MFCGNRFFVSAFCGQEICGKAVGVGERADAADFFEVKEDQAHGAFEVEGFDGAGDVEEGGYAGSVVISARRGGDGVEVCAQDEDFACQRWVFAAEFDDDVVPDLWRGRTFFGLGGDGPFYFLKFRRVPDCGEFLGEQGFGSKETFDVGICAAGRALEREGIQVVFEGVRRGR